MAAILIGTWVFYLTFEGPTRFDISHFLTLPLLVAADFTAIATLYAAARYYVTKKGTPTPDELFSMLKGEQADQEQDKNESENNKF